MFLNNYLTNLLFYYSIFEMMDENKADQPDLFSIKPFNVKLVYTSPPASQTLSEGNIY